MQKLMPGSLRRALPSSGRAKVALVGYADGCNHESRIMYAHPFQMW